MLIFALMSESDALGTEKITTLLRKQGVPAALGILTLSINGIIDNIFVGQYIGSLGIGAITVVLPITFLIASIGMSIGIGGMSIITRSMGAGDKQKAYLTFGNQAILTVALSLAFVAIGYLLQGNVLSLFGGKGDILPLAHVYFNILLPSVPLLAWAMMSNNVFRGEGKPRVAMVVMILPAIVNIILDAVFIIGLDMGMEGAAYATAIAYASSGLYALWYVVSGRSEMKLSSRYLRLNGAIVREIFSIGSVTLVRQGVVSVLSAILNNLLFIHGGEGGIAIWGIINRTVLFANFPVFGAIQGFLPIAGYNYGAKKWDRVLEAIRASLKYGTLIASGIFCVIMIFTPQVVSLFTNEPEMVKEAVPAMRIVFSMTFTLTLQLIGAAYFQAIGMPKQAMILTLLKQAIFLIPIVLILPSFLGLTGIWIAFPISDGLTAIANFIAIRWGIRRLEKRA